MEDQLENHAGPSTAPARYTRTRKRTLEQIAETVQPERPQEPANQMESDQEEQERGQAMPEQAIGLTPDRGQGVARDLKLKMPEYKGKKGSDPQVHVQAFENWAELRGLPRAAGGFVFHRR